MAFFEAALAATCSSLSSSKIPSISSSSRFQRNVRSIQAITALSKRSFSAVAGGCNEADIEDLGVLRNTQKKNKVADSLLHRFRRKSGLFVTDITSTFDLLFSKRKTNKAMKKGKARHVKLEEEVVKKVKVSVQSVEDKWAVKFMNFISGANQFLFEGLTRELQLIGFAEGLWMVGIVDEIRMPEGENNRNPILVDTKTRVRKNLPAEPQRRNGRLQLMCYKLMWDNLVADNFPSRQFFDFFSLNPYNILSEQIRDKTAKAGIPAKTLDDMVRHYRNTCSMLLPADNQMVLRYELQEDNSLLGEDQFTYDPDWLKSQIQRSLEFWLGEREASYVPEEERWKCRYCRFASANVCPTNTVSDSSSPANTNNHDNNSN